MGASRRYRRRLGTGVRALFIQPSISETMSVNLRDALALRNASAVEGQCPRCGARPERVFPPYPGELASVEFWHEAGCPALTDSQAQEFGGEVSYVAHPTSIPRDHPLLPTPVEPGDPAWFALPGVAAKLKRARVMVGSDPPVCPHIRPGNEEFLPLVCAQHSEFGLHCVLCNIAHSRSHTAEEERGCDGCGQIPPPGTLKPIFEVGTVSVVVHIDGRRHLLVGPVTIGCLGVCLKCREEVAA